MNPVTEAAPTEGFGPLASSKSPKQARSSAERILGPAFTLREINFVRWALLIIILASSGLKVELRHIQSGHFLRGFEGDFVYFYGFGRQLNQYPASRLYDYELQAKICNELHPLTTGEYGPNPYPPFV